MATVWLREGVNVRDIGSWSDCGTAVKGRWKERNMHIQHKHTRHTVSRPSMCMRVLIPFNRIRVSPGAYVKHGICLGVGLMFAVLPSIRRSSSKTVLVNVKLDHYQIVSILCYDGTMRMDG